MERRKYFLLLIALSIFSCVDKPDIDQEPDLPEASMAQLVVMDGHDLRSARPTPSRFTLSEDFTDKPHSILIKKLENGEEVLLHDGFISKETGLDLSLKLGAHTEDLIIEVEHGSGVVKKEIKKGELSQVILSPNLIGDTGSNNSNQYVSNSVPNSPPPSSDCSLYPEFNGNDDGSYKISGNSSAGINANKSTTIYICNGASWTPAYINGSQKKLSVYVGSGGTLNLSSSSTEIQVFNEGTLNASSNLNLGPHGLIENWGTISVSGITTINGTLNNYAGSFSSNNHVNVNGGGAVYNDGEDNGGATFTAGGNLNISQTFHNKANSTLTVNGHLTVNGSAQFHNYCKTIITGRVQNNGTTHLKAGSYTSVGARWTNNGSAVHKIFSGSYMTCANITSNTHIIGSGTYSVVQTNNLNFSYGKKFKGPIDVCANNYTASLGDGSVISSCTTVIPATTCSVGINDVIDEDGDCIASSEDVDDSNANVASYNYPQGQGVYYTAVYEDLWPCEGDYDFNDIVHNYSYREGWNSGTSCDAASSMITEVQFNYKFPALGATYNNALVLRVMDTGDDAVLVLNASASYSDEKITRLHDDINATTSFIFTDLKSIYGASGGQIINTRNRDYSSIPTLTGIVTGIDGGYDEYVLINNKSGDELHHTVDSNQQSYSALNNPTKYNNDRFGECNDSSSGASSYVNVNGLPWAITDIPIEWEWAKEFTPLTEAYPDFATFATSNPELDWYSDANPNKVSNKIFKD
jgi:LruC domain-containing protein